MAVLLTVSPGVYGGFTLYRDRRRPFSEQSRTHLQDLVPHLTNAVRNCRDMAVARTGDRLLEELYRRQNAAFLVLVPPGSEKMRSLRTTALLEKWFTRSEHNGSGIPRVLVEQLDALTRMVPAARLMANTWMDSRDHEHLVVKFVELPEACGPRMWALVLHEFSHSLPMPEEWRRRLTQREVEIVEGMLRNWNNEQIAEELGIAPATVKTHVKNIFGKLGIDSRADLMYQAARFLKPI
jgi:DNA-binding CsgD family transcriptional regulator